MSCRLAAVGVFLALPLAHAGELTRRFERTLERVLQGQPPRFNDRFVLADLDAESRRRFANFSGDLSGRYLGAVALAGPEGLAKARSLVPSVFDLQREDGGFGAPLSASGATADDMARLWGHGRMLVGLVEYLEQSGDARALLVAKRLGDFLLAHADRFNASAVRRRFQDGAMAHGYICWTQNVEALALLARAAGDDRYRTAASVIADAIERRPGQHAHGWLTSLRGLALLAEDQASLLATLEAEWESYVASENLLWTGGPPEYFAPGIERDEGCASADWVRLNLDLWHLTGKQRYIAAAEAGLFNAFFANQQPSGDFGHLTLTEDGFDYGAVPAWWCCTLHGLRAFAAIRRRAFRAAGDALEYGLAVDATASFQGLEIEADAELASEGRVTFRVIQAPAEAVRLRVRSPARATRMRSPSGAADDVWHDFERVWTPGEAWTVHFALESATPEERGARVAGSGPFILGVSEGGAPAVFDTGFDTTWPDPIVTSPGDRPSRLRTSFEQADYGGEAAEVELRPIAERWESAAHALRWMVRVGAQRGTGKRSIASWAADYREPLAIGFAAGLLLAALTAWLLRRRARPR